MIIGHTHILKELKELLSQNRFPQTSIFYGLKGIGKNKVALECAHFILGQNENAKALLLSGSHPDFFFVSPEVAKSASSKSSAPGSIRTEQILALKKALQYPPLLGARQVVIFDDAHRLTGTSANSLLKILEEPKPHQIFILITPNLYDLLITVRSRAAKFYFKPLLKEEVKTIIKSQNQPDVPFLEEAFDFYYKVFPGSVSHILEGLNLPIPVSKWAEFLQGPSTLLAHKNHFQKLSKETDVVFFLNVLEFLYFEKSKTTASFDGLDILDKIKRAKTQLSKHISEEFVLENLFL